MRLDHLQGEGGCDRGVKGVAAPLQDRHADRSGDPMGRGDDAERAFEFRTGGERIWIDVGHAGGKLARRPPTFTPRNQLELGVAGTNLSATPFMQ